MQIPVLIEPVAGNGFRARTGEPLACTAEGPTRAEAIGKLRALVQARVAAGALVALDIAEESPWARFAGMFKDNPLFDRWLDVMAESRRAIDEDPEAW